MTPGTLNLVLKRGITFGPVTISCTDADNAVLPLGGWSAFAHVRKDPAGPLVLDFAPVIAGNDTAGLVTLPAVPWATTATLAAGVYFWDLLLQDPAGRRLDPILSGTVTVTTPLTQP